MMCAARGRSLKTTGSWIKRMAFCSLAHLIG
jgi:hypothetical protein